MPDASIFTLANTDFTFTVTVLKEVEDIKANTYNLIIKEENISDEFDFYEHKMEVTLYH